MTRIVELAGGSPFALVELARHVGSAHPWEQTADTVALAGLDPKSREILQRVAVIGRTFDTDEFVAISDLTDDDAFRHLDAAIDEGVIEHTGASYNFRHGLVRDALIRDVAPHRRRRIHRGVAERLEALGASPARVGHHFVEAGDPVAAGPHLLRAAEREAAIGAYRDAFELVERVQAHVDGPLRARALSLRADLLFALGDPSAPVAYRHTLDLAHGVERRLLLARLTRAAVIAGDMDTAVAALEGVKLDGGPADADILLARGQVAFFTGDLGAARALTEDARRRVLAGDKSWQVLDLIALEGLLAHSRRRVVRPDARGAAAHPAESRAGASDLRRVIRARRNTSSTGRPPTQEVIERGPGPPRDRPASRRPACSRLRWPPLPGKPPSSTATSPPPTASSKRPLTSTTTSAQRPAKRTHSSASPRSIWRRTILVEANRLLQRALPDKPGGRPSPTTCCSGSSER